MSSTWNNGISISVFGEANGTAMGIVLDNLPPGEYIDKQKVVQFMTRRMGSDTVPAEVLRIQSGLLENRTTGMPLCAVFANPPQQPQPEQKHDVLLRPGHADYTGTMRYRGFYDVRGDGHFSDRLTVPLCFAGAICGQILERRGIYTGSHILSVHGIQDTPFSETTLSREQLLEVRKKAFPVCEEAAGEAMQEDISNARTGGETLGAVIECGTVHLPAGIGSPLFDGLQNTIAQLLFSIPSVCGVEFGAGFRSAEMTGSQYNDPFYVDEKGHIKTKTNHHGGVLGGISSGMPLLVKVALKPPATIGKPQETVELRNKSEQLLPPQEMQDACAAEAAVPAVEAAVNVALLSHMLDYPHF